LQETEEADSGRSDRRNLRDFSSAFNIERSVNNSPSHSMIESQSNLEKDFTIGFDNGTSSTNFDRSTAPTTIKESRILARPTRLSSFYSHALTNSNSASSEQDLPDNLNFPNDNHGEDENAGLTKEQVNFAKAIQEVEVEDVDSPQLPKRPRTNTDSNQRSFVNNVVEFGLENYDSPGRDKGRKSSGEPPSFRNSAKERHDIIQEVDLENVESPLRPKYKKHSLREASEFPGLNKNPEEL